ncbi:SDR family oxidoreductase [Aestuariicella hydrocarbonica]|uniref:SDR family oxidoreductase n=1 Tax=Pseudomaricurvus hydrocarbonicus TaxID=1470433 RepID=A0A9E5JWG7_9GAMM|nr:SDR family oxidoreductase [Aestuariicella hydrocarbonica]NHO66853.1 SDR family oxidoreductase [Aestuariicella hydrocarbonica]
MPGRLEGKVAVILGVSDERSMAATTARRFHAEGAKLVLAGRQLDKVQSVAAPLGAAAVVCDITVESQLQQLASKALDEFGKLDIAINFAGIDASAPIAETTEEMLQQTSNVHFIGATLFIKQMAAQMKAGGSIVTTSSQASIISPPGLGAYGGSKAGADQVVRIAAGEYGAQNIRVNSLAPGFTPTAMTADYLKVPTIEQAFLREIPLNRLPTADDIANAALWLASDEAFITGQILDISGGQTLRRIPTPEEMGF